MSNSQPRCIIFCRRLEPHSLLPNVVSFTPPIESVMSGIGVTVGTPKKKQKTSNEDEDKSATSTEAVNDSATDWRDKYKHVRDMHIHALEKKHLADVVFIVGEEKVSFSAHRMILALGSPVFEAMFFGGLAEKGESVSIPDVDPKGFECLLRFLYSGNISFDNDTVAFKTFFAADKYWVPRLKLRCERYLTKRLKCSNAWSFLEISLSLKSQKLIDHCLYYLSLFTRVMMEDNSFLNATTKCVETFLSLDKLNLSEMRVLLRLVQWAEHKSISEPDAVESFRKFFMPLLKLVKFSDLTYEDFVLFHEKPKVKEVLNNKDALAILKYIIKPNLCSLPDWCRKRNGHVMGPCSCRLSNGSPFNKTQGKFLTFKCDSCCIREWKDYLSTHNMSSSSSDSSDHA